MHMFRKSAISYSWWAGLLILALCLPLTAQNPSRKKDKKQESEDTRYFKRWMEEDVFYIITPEEKSVFKNLTTPEEKEKFIDEFWRMRDPSPESIQNEFKEEHYRRISYANDRFASGTPGWKTDRGMVYITFGKPDRQESHPTGTHLVRSELEGGDMTTYPFEVWEYRYIEGIGTDVTIEFVDQSGTNDYKIALNDYDKDALFSITGSRVRNTMYSSGDSTDSSGNSITGSQLRSYKDQPFEKLRVYSQLQRPPEIKFKKLESAVTARVIYKQLPVQIQENYVRVTDESAMAAVALEIDNKNLSYEAYGETYQATVNIYGRVTDITKRIVEVFEDVVSASVTEQEMKNGIRSKSVYQKKLTLRPGRYILDGAAEDVKSGRMASIQQLLVVPKLNSEQGLAGSSLILASVVTPVENDTDLRSMFVLGSTRVIPNIRRVYKKGDKVVFYQQAYHLNLDQTTQKPNMEVTATVKKDNQVVLEVPASDLNLKYSGEQCTITGFADGAKLEPGGYRFEIKISDKIANNDFTRTIPFTVE